MKTNIVDFRAIKWAIPIAVPTILSGCSGTPPKTAPAKPAVDPALQNIEQSGPLYPEPECGFGADRESPASLQTTGSGTRKSTIRSENLS